MNVKQFIRVLVTVTAVLLTASYAVAQGNSGGHGNGGGNGGGGGGGGHGPSYDLVELDSWDGLFEGYAKKINNTGLVVGWVNDPILEGGFPACWTVDNTGGDVTSTLHVLSGGRAAGGVNDFGEIVGYNNNAEAVYWEDFDAEPLVLPTPPGTTESYAGAINNNGLILGSLKVPDSGGQLSDVAVIWQTTESDPIELPRLQPTNSMYVRAINDLNGQGIALVVGQEEGETAVAWTVRLIDGTLVVDPPVVLDSPFANASDVNNSGMICGDVRHDAVVWDGNSTLILDRSATINEPGGTKTCYSAQAQAINADGVIVGRGSFQGGYIQAVVWPSPSGSMLVLNKLIKKSPNLSYAWDVNDAGEIVCRGWNKNQSLHQGYVAIPK